MDVGRLDSESGQRLVTKGEQQRDDDDGGEIRRHAFALLEDLLSLELDLGGRLDRINVGARLGRRCGHTSGSRRRVRTARAR